ncbi:MAG: hypothetical protein H0W01_13105 [Pseudonocardiales bacterium]|nr:hypothetical protein [Pseudonocardiales bacterium]
MAGKVLDRFALAVLEGIPKRLWGFPPLLMPVLADQLGPLRAVRWFLWNMPRYERTLKAFGGFRTHLLSTTISLINGCRYCTFGHAYALQLIYLRDHGELFPLDEHAMTELRGVGPDELRRRLVEALQQAGMDTEVPWVDRLIALVTGRRKPAGHDEGRLMHLVRMFGVLNGCGIAGDVLPDQAHDPINTDDALKERYAKLRAAAVS